MNKTVLVLLSFFCVVCPSVSNSFAMDLDIPDDVPVSGQEYGTVTVYDELPGESFVDLHDLIILNVKTYNSSVTHLNHTQVRFAYVYDDSVVNFNNSEASHISTFDESVLNYSGDFTSQIDAYSQSTVNFYDGIIASLDYRDQSKGNVYGGVPANIDISGDSIVNIYGGQILYFGVKGNGIANIYGYDFDYDGTYMTGFWEGGDAFKMQWKVEENSNVNLITIPEPATLLLFGLGGLVVRQRRSGCI